MKIEDQLCSLELSIKLKEIGIEQTSSFFWISSENPKRWWLHADNKFAVPFHPNHVSAFTVAELMYLIPARIDINKNEPFNVFSFALYKSAALNIQYIASYRCDTYSEIDVMQPKLNRHNIFDEKLADCLAKTLIWIHENGYK